MGCEETISLSVITAAALRTNQVYVIPLQYANDQNLSYVVYI